MPRYQDAKEGPRLKVQKSTNPPEKIHRRLCLFLFDAYLNFGI
jgi:hypothetical protein